MKQRWFILILFMLNLLACQNTQQPPSPIILASQAPALPANQIFVDNQLKAQLIEQLNQLSPQPLQEKPVISTLALEHAQQLAEDQSETEFRILNYQPIPPKPLVQRLLQLQIYSWDNIFNSFFSTQDPQMAISQFTQQVKNSFQATPFTHYGLAVIKKGEQWFVSLILITEIVQLKGMDTNLPTTGTRQVTGRIVAPGYTNPTALITQPNGEVVDGNLKLQGQNFHLDFPFDQKGHYSFEINVEGVLGPQPATNFVVSVGVEPLPPRIASNEKADRITDLTKARQTLLDLINEDRKELDLSPVELDFNLNLAAQSHSKDMVDNQFVGHTSPTQGTVQEQVADFEINDIVAQNIAVSRSLENSQEELMSSPGHRRTIINPENTHVGFGIALGQDGFLYITQNYSRKKAILDPLPPSVEKETVLIVSGKVLNHSGLLGVFLNKAIVGDPIKVFKDATFSVPVQIPSNGKTVKIQLGLSSNKLSDEKLSFDFTHSWEMELKEKSQESI